MGGVNNFVNLVWLTALIGSRGSFSLTSAAQTPRQFHHLSNNINHNNRGLQYQHHHQQHRYNAQQYLEYLAASSSCFSPPRGGAATLSAVTSSTDGVANTTHGESSSSSSSSSIFNAGEMVVPDPSKNRGPLKVLFLSADTGGGHRASAESLAKQFQIHFPGSTYELLDIWTEHGVVPYRTLVNAYKHLSAHPRQWRFLYHLSNSRPWELAMDWHSAFMCEKRIRNRIEDINPDVVVSVHPAMQNVPLISTRKISQKTGKHLPFFTVVTDLGSGHCTWFQKNPEKLYVASDRLYRLAKRRGRTPDDNIVMTGLPIRNDFAVEAQKLGDRTTLAGKEYQTFMKEKLGLADTKKPMVLVMGGGEGVGSLSDIVDELYTAMTRHGVDATICVVCGRNEKLQKQLAERDWNAVVNKAYSLKPKRRTRLFRWLFRRRRAVAPSPEIEADFEQAVEHHDDVAATPGKVDVVGLGFVTNMAEYMVAADILVTKAGPGTIAEAAAVGLPIMLTSFLPGQEAGNVDFVLENGFGDFRQEPVEIGEEVGMWLKDENLLHSMSHKARDAGHPSAASDIVIDIGSVTHTWMALNGGSNRIEVASKDAQEAVLN